MAGLASTRGAMHWRRPSNVRFLCVVPSLSLGTCFLPFFPLVVLQWGPERDMSPPFQDVLGCAELADIHLTQGLAIFFNQLVKIWQQRCLGRSEAQTSTMLLLRVKHHRVAVWPLFGQQGFPGLAPA